MLMFRAMECSSYVSLQDKLSDVSKQYLVGMEKFTRKADIEYIEYIIQQQEKTIWITPSADEHPDLMVICLHLW